MVIFNFTDMKKIILPFIAASFALAACQDIENYSPELQDVVLSATIDQEEETRTYMDEANKTLWSANDRIVAFVKSSNGQQYQIQSSYAGKTYADFSALTPGNSGNNDLNHIVAYYPYGESVKCTASGDNYLLDVVLPSEQTYVAESFGNGSFPMAAASTDKNLTFKNVCGGIKLNFKGSAKVTSINIQGKNNEKLSGAAVVTVSSDGADPVIAMASSASTSATLNCSSYVQLSESKATEFIISLPPVEFSKGFTVTVTDNENRTYTASTDKKNVVYKNSLLVMPAMTLVRDVTVADNLSGWTDVTANYGTLPDYLKIYKSPSYLEGVKAVVYIAVADVKKGARWDIYSAPVDKSATNGANGWLTTKLQDGWYFYAPSVIYEAQNYPPVLINGGYFYYEGGYNTASLATRNSLAPLAYNINYEYDSSNSICYPTRAAFLEYDDGSFDACWTYVLFTWYDHFIYPEPAPANNKNQPSISYPSGGKYFAAKTGIGGGPVLIDKGVIKNSWNAEMLSGINPTGRRPRTALGVTANKEIVFFAAEGDGKTSGVYGFTTSEVANILHDLGCVEAINLDGGGSTCMLVNGRETIQPSDGSQREIASAVMLW